MFPFPNNFWLRNTGGAVPTLYFSNQTFPTDWLDVEIGADVGGWNSLTGFSPIPSILTLVLFDVGGLDLEFSIAPRENVRAVFRCGQVFPKRDVRRLPTPLGHFGIPGALFMHSVVGYGHWRIGPYPDWLRNT
jgi:hypothetical protein